MESYPTAFHIERPTLTRFIATFGFAWLMVGLFTGTLVLVLLIRWLVGLLHHWGWGQTAQNRVLIGTIVVFIVASFMLTRAIVRRLFRMTSVRARRGALASLVVPGALAMWAWSNPSKLLAGLAGGGADVTLAMAGGGPQFQFGAYPDEARLRELKAEGVRTIVSLQHPAVLVELQGINDERDAAAKLGLHFIQIPMLPWVSDNTAALERIRQLALHGRGKYYIHCGLGRDRVNIAKRVIEALQDSTNARVLDAGVVAANGFENRKEPFERGKLFQMAPQTWLIPYPNGPEMHGFILQGRPGHVFLMLNPADTLQARWIAEAEAELRDYAVPFTYLPFAPKDTVRAAAIAAQLKAQRPPLTIIVPGTSWTEPSKSVSSVAAAVVFHIFGAIPDSAHPALRLPGTTARATAIASRRGK